jgi:hypothetical protein
MIGTNKCFEFMSHVGSDNQETLMYSLVVSDEIFHWCIQTPRNSKESLILVPDKVFKLMGQYLFKGGP